MASNAGFVPFQSGDFWSPNMRHLPAELEDNISSMMESETTDRLFYSRFDENPAMRAPADGSSPFVKLPTELRRAIFAAVLPDPSTIFRPTGKDDKKETSRSTRASRKPTKTKTREEPPKYRVLHLMLLNKQIKDEVALMLYEERFFIVQAHEGLRDGGIEFLNVGRLPLQYQDRVQDPRFNKFHVNDTFGFHRLKKIIVEIHPTTEQNTRHTSVSTYFMNLALCRLLDRYGENRDNRISSLIIRFGEANVSNGNAVGRLAIQRGEYYWWDPDLKKPRETSVHNLSNVELVLRPFAHLTGCHSVNIELPKGVRDHAPSIQFAETLVESMQSQHGGLIEGGDLEERIGSARAALEEYIECMVNGKEPQPVEKLTDIEMAETHPDTDDIDSDNEQATFEQHLRSKWGIDISNSVHATGSANGRDGFNTSNASVLEGRTLRSGSGSTKNNPDTYESYHAPDTTGTGSGGQAAGSDQSGVAQHTGVSSPLRGALDWVEDHDDFDDDDE